MSRLLRIPPALLDFPLPSSASILPLLPSLQFDATAMDETPHRRNARVAIQQSLIDGVCFAPVNPSKSFYRLYFSADAIVKPLTAFHALPNRPIASFTDCRPGPIPRPMMQWTSGNRLQPTRSASPLVLRFLHFS